MREAVESDGTSRHRPWAALTDRDLLRSAARIQELTAGEAATGELLQVHPDDRLAEVGERMLEHAVTGVLVVDPDTGRPVGALSTLDVAGILAWAAAEPVPAGYERTSLALDAFRVSSP